MSIRSKWRLAALTVGLVILVGVSIFSTLVAGREQMVFISPDVTPRMTAGDVMKIANERLASMAGMAPSATAVSPSISTVRALRADQVQSIESQAGIEVGPSVDPGRAIWVVRATGTFVGLHTRQLEPIVFGSGFLLIDDSTGEIVGMGMP